MKIITKEIKAYEYAELSADAREVVKTKYLDVNRLPEYFTESVVEDLQQSFGLFDLKTWYSLSYSQGDGLCLYGQIDHQELFDNEDFREIAFKDVHYKQKQSVYEVLQGIKFKHSGRYYSANSVDIISIEDGATEKQREVIEKVVENVTKWYLKFCNECVKDGYKYFYEISDSEIQEICEQEGYLFTQEGELV